jgi:hypothetical protein
MGFNTVAFVLNDFSSDLLAAPKTTAELLVYGGVGGFKLDEQRQRFARLNKEPAPHFQAMSDVVSFHADDTHWFRAGGNSLDTLKFVRFGKAKDKRVVILEVPDWLSERLDRGERTR